MLVPVAGVPLGYTDISWFFFSIGILFWGMLLTIIFYRVLFDNPLEERLMPTLFILIAPPAVGFIAYTRLTGERAMGDDLLAPDELRRSATAISIGSRNLFFSPPLTPTPLPAGAQPLVPAGAQPLVPAGARGSRASAASCS